MFRQLDYVQSFIVVLMFFTNISTESPLRIDIPNPVILVPGDGGSQLEAKLNKTSSVHYWCKEVTEDYFSLWLNLELLVPGAIDCMIDNMKLVYDNVTRTTSNSPGVDIRVPGFGNSTVVEYIDPSKISVGGYFSKIADLLVTLGYERNVSIKGAPYDFRRAPNENEEYFVNLKDLVETTYKENGNKKVVFIAHSMGALMCLEFFHRQTQSWKDQYIRTFITLSGVWGGSVKAIKVFAIGDDLGVFILSGSVLREEQITSPSLAWLLPSPIFWKDDEILVETPNKNYTLSNLEDFFRDIDYINGWEMRKDVERYAMDFAPPGVELHCLHGYGVSTVERLSYKAGVFPTGKPTLINGDGDGTVNKRSLEGCLHWKPLQSQNVYHTAFPNVNHMEILTSKYVFQYIEQLFREKL